MSGIAGIFNLNERPLERPLLAACTEALAHRGPDGSGLWFGDSIGLGQCLLQSTPGEAVEPAMADGGRLILTADVRLDHRLDLARSLGCVDEEPDLSDSDLILRAYTRWGEDCLTHLLGAFAFAIWDGPQRRLFCARDHLGRRPLYYTHTASTFAFASEIKALLVLPWVTNHINEVRVADYLTFESHDPWASFYTDVSRLPAAHALRVTPEGIRPRKYWSLDRNQEVRYRSDADYADAFREHFTASVRGCVRSSHPVGSMLSGGLDSSAITCAARALLGTDEARPLDTFSNVYDALPACDERRYIEAVLSKEGFRAHYHVADQHSLFEDLDRMLWHVDEPFFTPNLFLSWHLWKEAQATGVRVVLDGFLGDNVVNHGSRHLTELAASLRWISLIRETRRVSTLHDGGTAMQRHLIRQFGVEPLVREPLRRVRRRFQRQPPQESRFLHPDFARHVDVQRRAEQFRERPPRSVREEHYSELTAHHLTEALEITNKAAVAFGVEPRFPFADRRLMEFCLALPPTQRYRNGWTRFILRNALRDILPRAIHTRVGKANLGPNYDRSLLALGRAELDSLIYERLTVASAYLDVESVRRHYQATSQRYDEKGRPGTDVLPFGLIAILTRWLETIRGHVGSEPARPCHGSERGRLLHAVAV